MGNTFTNDEITSLTRDGLSRSNPDALAYGFFPAWAVNLKNCLLLFMYN